MFGSGAVPWLAAIIALVGSFSTGPTESVAASCPDLLVAHSSVAGFLVGESNCAITANSTFTDSAGNPWQRVDVALSGTVGGYADPVTVGNTRKDLTDAPNILFPQFGITSWVPGVGTYTGGADGQGAGISVLYPADPARWTGKVVVLAHGQANNTPLGTIVPQTVGGPLPQDTFDNLYADEFVDAGYAVIYTRRPASSGVPTKLTNGMTLDESVNDNVTMLRDFMLTGERLLAERLHRLPSLALWYGHSAGVIVGRLFNYSGLNDRPMGGHYVAGFLSDDPGGGLPLPLAMPMGQVLGDRNGTVTYPGNALLSSAAKAQLVPEFTFAHALYVDQHSWLPDVTYLTLKQLAEQLYRQEGLTKKTDLYVVAGVSHIPNSTGSPAHTLDMGGLIQAAIPIVQSWVTKGISPPVSITGRPGDAGRANQLLLPPLACPTGFRYPWPAPAGASSRTGYVPFDGTAAEPVNSQGTLADVNGDGVRDTMPSVTQEWQRLGLVHGRQAVTRQAFVSCVQHDVGSLVADRLLTPATAATYVTQAESFPSLDW
ncbi:MAG TPA: hypothetical protein VFX16_23150 [Pseudonocardiaceae bacterium]|nr:hypothetical protein [Pseudonocardiaceae bacterium]